MDIYLQNIFEPFFNRKNMDIQNEKTELRKQHPLAKAGFFSRLFFL